MNYPDQKKEIPQATTAWAWRETGHYWTGERREEVNYVGTKETKTHSSIKVQHSVGSNKKKTKKKKFSLLFFVVKVKALILIFYELYISYVYSCNLQMAKSSILLSALSNTRQIRSKPTSDQPRPKNTRKKTRGSSTPLSLSEVLVLPLGQWLLVCLQK